MHRYHATDYLDARGGAQPNTAKCRKTSALPSVSVIPNRITATFKKKVKTTPRQGFLKQL